MGNPLDDKGRMSQSQWLASHPFDKSVLVDQDDVPVSFVESAGRVNRAEATKTAWWPV
jgi:hypothetical protein